MPSASTPPRAPVARRWSGDAATLVARWPTDLPLAALVSGGADATHNAWTILARPQETIVIPANCDPSVALDALSAALARTPRPTPERAREAGAPPFAGGWVVALGYGLGSLFEPGAMPRAATNTDQPPLAVLHWCEDAWCLDHATGMLHAVGVPPALVDADEPAASTDVHDAWQLSMPAPDEPDDAYRAVVARVVEFIRAGDAFQANLARRFQATLRGDLRAFACAAIRSNASWFGACIDLPGGGALVSMSPELFLRVAADGRVATRPIKGTRPATDDPRALLESDKDAAELAMIVDLMRNDLGRIAEIGSVEVVEGRTLETHETVHHGVAEVRARLRPGTGWLELLAATFPPGSVTGAPKVRAMQIIDELERAPRGFYCGAIGFLSRCGHAGLSVAIRTAHLSAPGADGARRVVYHAGCGIVADSDPALEVAETHAKARALVRLAGA